jgi:hypothetical protein
MVAKSYGASVYVCMYVYVCVYVCMCVCVCTRVYVCMFPECSAQKGPEQNSSRERYLSWVYIPTFGSHSRFGGWQAVCILRSVWIEEASLPGHGAAPGMAASRAMIP